MNQIVVIAKNFRKIKNTHIQFYLKVPRRTSVFRTTIQFDRLGFDLFSHRANCPIVGAQYGFISRTA